MTLNGSIGNVYPGQIPLKSIDLDSLIPVNERVVFDLKNWLKDELILIEKDFRDAVKNHDWVKKNVKKSSF